MFDDFDNFVGTTSVPSLGYVSLKNKNGVAILVSDEACTATRFCYQANTKKIVAYADAKIVAEIKLKKGISDIISKSTLVVKVNTDGVPYAEYKLDM